MNRHYNFDELPLLTSPPIIFQFKQSATVAGGIYEWTAGRIDFTPIRPINPTTTYYFRTLSMFADIVEEDYRSAVGATNGVEPVFRAYLKENAGASFFREAVPLGGYLANIPFEYALSASRSGNALQGNIQGTLVQIPSLLGKPTITLSVVLSVQEINDQAFASSLKAGFK